MTGFLGSQTTIQLLNKGYEVVGTLRDKSRINSIKEVISKHTANIYNLKCVVADLNNSNIWSELTRSIDYVQHIASPFPRDVPKHENDLITPAKQGTLHLLKAATANNVKQVVMVPSLRGSCLRKNKKGFG